MLVAMVIFGVMTAFAVGGWTALNRSQAQRSTADDILTLFRDTQQRAVTEGTTYCVTFSSPTSWQLKSGSTCGTSLETYAPATGAVVRTTPAIQSTAHFYPRGNADAFVVVVSRGSSATTYTITVDAFTGHVKETSP